MKSKILKRIIIILVAVFLVYNIIWACTVNKIYGPCKQAIGSTCLNENGYTYSVNYPKYPSYEGNMSISEDIYVAGDGSSEATCDLLIWPLGNGEYEFGVSMLTGTVGKSENYSMQVELDENMQLVGQYGKEEVEMYEKSLPKIEMLYKLAKEKWGIGK